ncbi:MAG: 6-phosphogluconolactonase [Stappiaceae bacterium]
MTTIRKTSNPNEASSEWPLDRNRLNVFDSRGAMAEAAAVAIARRISDVIKAKSMCRMIFAAAPSQSELIAALVEMPDIPWAKVTAFHMDDYLGLPADAPQRFSNWLDRHLFSKVDLGGIHRIRVNGEAEDICDDYSSLLAEAPIDIVCLGIGVNGHIAFNDPPIADFNDPAAVRVVELDAICRQQQVDDECFSDIADVPTHAVTLTIPRLLAADALYCVVPGSRKRNAVKAALEGPVSTACPASILRTHPDLTFFLDTEANPDGR